VRDPCPYCGLPDVSWSSVDFVTKEIVRDIRDHACPYWAPVAPLPAGQTDVSFIREARNTAQALAAWRKAIR
jgi:hypothetical protein